MKSVYFAFSSTSMLATRAFLISVVLFGAPAMAIAGLPTTAAGKTLYQSGKTITQKSDGSIVITEVGAFANAAGNFDDDTRISEAQEIYAAQNPDKSTDCVTSVSHFPDGTVVVITIAGQSPGDALDGRDGPPSGDPPPRDGPPADNTDGSIDRITYHGSQNGYTRTTRWTAAPIGTLTVSGMTATGGWAVTTQITQAALDRAVAVVRSGRRVAIPRPKAATVREADQNLLKK